MGILVLKVEKVKEKRRFLNLTINRHTSAFLFLYGQVSQRAVLLAYGDLG